eukprot:g6151.t1
MIRECLTDGTSIGSWSEAVCSSSCCVSACVRITSAAHFLKVSSTTLQALQVVQPERPEPQWISLNLNPVCTNSSLPDDDWKAMHAEVAELAVLSQHLAAEFILVRQGQSFNEKKLDSLLVDLETSVRRIMFGSSQPVLAAPPKQMPGM